MNNFKKLAEEQGLFEKTPPDHIQQKISGSMEFLELFANIIDLFVPRIISVFKDLLGANRPSNTQTIEHGQNNFDQKPPKYPNRAD